MDAEHPDLPKFRRERINELEERRFAKLTRGANPFRDREMSEASTATLNAEIMSRQQSAGIRGIYDDEDLDDNRMDIDYEGASTNGEIEDHRTLIVATDFGTTFSSVAFAFRTESSYPDIRELNRFPEDPMTLNGTPSVQAPTESWYLEQSTILETEDEMVEDEWDIDSLNTLNEEYTPRSNFLWGYEVHELAARPDERRDQYNRVFRSKLLLDEAVHTNGVRAALNPLLRRLKKKKLIKNDEDVIADYLTQLFRHTKRHLTANYQISNSTTIEHVISVPVVWKAPALRAMQAAMRKATQASGLGTIDDLMFISEPESAAAYVLGKDRDQVQPGEAFLILDAGGGTVDATVYKVDKEYPLRLSEELVAPDGCLHGSSFLNEGFRQELMHKLQGQEQDIEINGYTLDGIVESQTKHFEERSKRTIDFTNGKMPPLRVQVAGLRANHTKRFEQNSVVFNRDDFIKIYEPHLIGIRDLMRKQLTAAKDAGHNVQKVVLIGGFSASISLRKFLAKQLKEISDEFGHRITLTNPLTAGEHETAVARGSIIRAWDKEDGPDRITQCSFGFEIEEEYNPEDFDAHKRVRTKSDSTNGVLYVENSMEWLVFKGDKIPFHAEFPVKVYRNFAATKTTYVIEETLYMADFRAESHYRKSHPKNKGAKVAGIIKVDMTLLVSEGRIPLIIPEKDEGKPHYRIEFMLVIIIHGRNLRYEARWPVGPEGQAHGGGQICIAAAFKPGVN